MSLCATHQQRGVRMQHTLTTKKKNGWAARTHEICCSRALSRARRSVSLVKFARRIQEGCKLCSLANAAHTSNDAHAWLG